MNSFLGELKEYFKVTVVVYIKRQDDLVDSLLNQHIKQGVIAEVDDRVIEKVLERFNYERLLAFWESCVGRDLLIARPFEKSQFYKGNLYSDFLYHAFRITEFPEGKLERSHLNARLFGDALVLKGLVNALSESVEATSLFRSILQEYCDRIRDSQSDRGYLLSPSRRLRIIETCSAINERISKRYFKDSRGELLFREAVSGQHLTEDGCVPESSLTTVVDFIEENNSELARTLYRLADAGSRSLDASKQEASARLRSFLGIRR